MQIVSLPAGQSWLGALIFVKTHDAEARRWSMRRTEGLSSEELLGIVSISVEMLRAKIQEESEE